MKNIHGGDIYQYNNILDFSANINPLGAPESVNRSIADAIGQIGHYPEMYSDSAPIAVSCGKSTGGRPSTCAAVSMPTSAPDAHDST